MRAPRFMLDLTLIAGVVLAAMAASAAPKAWVDVLDVPALASPLAGKGLFNGLAVAGQRMVGVGQRGHVVYSDDEGATWKQAEVPVSSDLVAVHFPTATQGWAVGHDGVVLHSADGGSKWKRQRDGRPDAAENPLLDVWFEDARQGWAVGAFGQVLRTTDGGANWTPAAKDLTDNPKDLHLYAVRNVAGDLFIVGEQGLVLRQDKASGRFRAIESPYKGTLFGITGNARALVAHGLRGNIVRSTDGGNSWQAASTGVPAGLTAGIVDTRGRIVLGSQAGHLISSQDDGASFAPVTPTGTSRPIPAAALLPTKNGYVVAGPRGVHALPTR